MSRLTLEERRRLSQARQQSSREMGTRISMLAMPAPPATPRYWLSQVVKSAMMVALLGGSWLAFHAVEFHMPRSIVEALLPRL